MFGYFWNAELVHRRVGVTCPEVPDRCRVLAPQEVFGSANGIQVGSFRSRDDSLLSLAHDAAYIAEVRNAHSWGRRYLDAGDTLVTPNVFEQSLLAASAGCEALDQIMNGRLASAFCAIRPPGHHANPRRAMGFCVFNNAAVAARYAQSHYGAGRILIVDWDVHPGNGTQEVFWNDPSVFTLSFHQADLFPESGRSDLVGEGAGKGFSRNVPLPPGTGRCEYLKVFEPVVTGVARAFQPELLLISAGFDAHARDPVARMELTEEDFGRMTEIVLAATQPFTGGRTLSLLEGGYNPYALQTSVAAHCRARATLPA